MGFGVTNPWLVQISGVTPWCYKSVALWDSSPGVQLSQKGPCSWRLCWCHLDVLSDAVLWFVLVSLVGRGTQVLGASAPCGRPSATSHLLYLEPLQKYSPSCHCLVMAAAYPRAPGGARQPRASTWHTAARSQDGQHAGWTSHPLPPSTEGTMPLGIQQPWKGEAGSS